MATKNQLEAKAKKLNKIRNKFQIAQMDVEVLRREYQKEYREYHELIKKR